MKELVNNESVIKELLDIRKRIISNSASREMFENNPNSFFMSINNAVKDNLAGAAGCRLFRRDCHTGSWILRF